MDNFKILNRYNRIKLPLILGGILVVAGVLLSLPNAFADLTPVRSVTITSEKLDYEKKDPGSFSIEKSAEWIARGKARITFNLDTIIKTENKYTDIIFVLDISGSMDGDKLTRVKQDSVELINTLLSNSNNRVALITFESDSKLVLPFTNNKENLVNKISNLTTGNNTNYYRPLINVDNVLKNYKKEANRECIVLFLTDGYPNEDTPNEKGQYSYLKTQYPYITINGVQYEMGSDVLEPIKKVSDHQFIADMTNLNNILFDASVAPSTYNEFLITDYINDDYFEIDSVDNIVASIGTTKLEYENNTPKVIWNIGNIRSGASANLTIDVNLKREFINTGGVYPTNKKEEIKARIDEVKEDITSPKTPVLADNYRVIYDGNAPENCTVKNIPETTTRNVFDTIEISNHSAVCDGYQFKGWTLVTKNVKKINDNYFEMPSSDVVLRANWSKMNLAKSIDGEVFVAQTLYKIIANQAFLDNEKSEFVTSSSGISFGESPSDTNGKGVYTIASTKDYEYPVHYFRGAVDNNNAKFAGFCWKIVRTTETGGVKLIYNGTPNDEGGCTNTTGTETEIGKSYYNARNGSIADVGYMYGNRYEYSRKDYLGDAYWYNYVGKGKDHAILTYPNRYNYYYGDSVTYNESTNTYTLINAKEYSWFSSYRDLKGKYTCLKETSDGCETVAYVDQTSEREMHYVKMSSGETYESFFEQANNYKWVYGNDVSYVDGKYVLKNTALYSPMTLKEDVKTGFNAHRYTCFTPDDTCQSVNYVFFNDSSNHVDYRIYEEQVYYFTLQNGLKIDDIIREMTTESTNENSSIIKTTIDDWYQKNLLDYTSYLEDTVWCSDRSIYQIGVFNKDEKSTKSLYYGAYGRNSYNTFPRLECVNDNDKFTVSTENGNGKLTYPVALLTADEATLAGNGYRGYSKDNYLFTGENEWFLSPQKYERYSPYTYIVNSYGSALTGYHVVTKYGVRPALSLRPGMLVSNGNGLPSNPYEVYLPLNS